RQAGASSRRFLIVDDDPGFVTLVSRMLEAEFRGVEVHGAYSGHEAMAILAQEDVDLVLMDLIMPELNGVELIESMRRDERLTHVPVIVTTGSSYAEEVVRRYPSKLTLTRGGPCSERDLGRHVSALLNAVPLDYTRPAPVAGQPATAAERQAS
ncbi:MAG: response regulator, partial [Anaerolineae bacterium]